MNAQDLTFGVEIECTLPRSVAIEVGAYHAGVQVEGLPAGWVAMRDGSIRAGRSMQGVEIVSPVLRGVDGLKQIQAVCRWLREKGARVNPSCGVHVHVGFGDRSPADLARLVTLISNFEKAIFATTGTKRRERGGFCRPIQASETHRRGEFNRTSRYHVLNVENLTSGRKPTVEFRAFSATTDATKIIGWVRLALGLVERAIELTRSPKWVAKDPAPTSPIRRAGEGQTAYARLCYQLGWTRGRAKRVYGAVEGAGLPSVKRSKATLLRLVRKYDESR